MVVGASSIRGVLDTCESGVGARRGRGGGQHKARDRQTGRAGEGAASGVRTTLRCSLSSPVAALTEAPTRDMCAAPHLEQNKRSIW